MEITGKLDNAVSRYRPELDTFEKQAQFIRRKGEEAWEALCKEARGEKERQEKEEDRMKAQPWDEKTDAEKVAFIERFGGEAAKEQMMNSHTQSRLGDPPRRSRMHPQEAVDYIKEHGFDAYNALPWD